jgi:threonine synthase
MGLYMGFGELRAQGIITKLPRLLGVQSAACCPVYRAYSEDRLQIERSPQTYETLAEGITSEAPIRGDTIMRALRETNGAITTVDEAEIEFGVKALASKGIYVEPTSAVIVKAFDKFVESGIIRAGDVTVSILTGSGLKATDKLMKIA